MKTVEIIGYKRANLGKKESKRLRAEGNVPCVVYGNDEQIHFYAPMILFRPLVYTPEAHMVDLNIEGEHKKCILQDIQFHPVNEIIVHADFLELQEKKPIKMEIPLHLVGNAPGVSKGGTLMFKRRALKLKALPKNMPEHIDVNISKLDFGKAIKVADVKSENFEILDNPAVSIAVIEVPRALRGKTAEEEAEEEGVEAESETTEE
ncbi:50S ribosomal protein L25/general stress protein Ctc [Catalinimonas niigatensis]|uniref:50S ribosomal protein L25/general stress protein Ctc n=1 Tax=Catalinimonas niigatensis TaxID=1397264 RepID=UPI0026660909|nr:50S ribosomal protein L25/general stress protein Ctc [Catalinimonas niigatensis]WPP50564.1 50S ribosomal protein L25/general stress protein Ctc [Catalinimonas niigatensis]